jgi:hypothetical protein
MTGSAGAGAAGSSGAGAAGSAGAGAAGSSVGALEPQAERIKPKSTRSVRILYNERFILCLLKRMWIKFSNGIYPLLPIVEGWKKILLKKTSGFIKTT